MAESEKAIPVVALQTVLCSDPDIALFILNSIENDFGSQPIFFGEFAEDGTNRLLRCYCKYSTQQAAAEQGSLEHAVF